MNKIIAILLLPFILVLTGAGQSQTAEEYFSEGMEYYKKQEHQKAIHAFSRALELKPDYAQAYLWRGIVYDDLGDTESSLKNYTKSIEIEPSAVAYNNRGIAKAIGANYEEAIKDYDEAIKLKPEYGVALMNRGFAWNELGENEKACKDWTEAKRKGVNSAQAILDEYCK